MLEGITGNLESEPEVGFLGWKNYILVTGDLASGVPGAYCWCEELTLGL